jgi:hypothetical protein
MAARRILALALLACEAAQMRGQGPPSQLNESGHMNVNGRMVPFFIRHLPVSSFPDVPPAITDGLIKRGCLIPQTYEAHRPENVIHGSFEKAGSADWAVLCSAGGTVSLLVFFASAPEKPETIASSPEMKRLQVHDLTGTLGFDWGIDCATPARVHEAQRGITPRPAKLDHDAVADSVVEHGTAYHYYLKGAWTKPETPE